MSCLRTNQSNTSALLQRRSVTMHCSPSVTTVDDVLSQPDVLSLIVSFLDDVDVQSLSATSTVSLNALNLVATDVVLCADSSHVRDDLSAVFPRARALTFDFAWPPCGPGDLRLLLRLVATNSSAFVSQLQKLVVRFGASPLTKHVTRHFCDFLLRCTSLQALIVKWASDANVAKLCGRGDTEEERCVSMQRQLAAFCATPTFLAPASWQLHGCLTDLQAPGAFQSSGASYPDYISASFLATSLQSLELTCDYLPDSFPWDEIGHLAGSLTKLVLLVSDDAVDEYEANYGDCDGLSPGVADAVGQLTSLASLDLHTIILDRFDVSEYYFLRGLPESWSQLCSLTHLRLQGEIVCLEDLCCLSNLRHLVLPVYSCASLSNLFELTALTSLSVVNHSCSDIHIFPPEQQGLDGGEDVAVPQQWQAGLRELQWGYSTHNMGFISQLTSLTSLLMRDFGRSLP